jgi:CRP-like cAMP-binding protein
MPSPPPRNLLLKALPEEERKRLAPFLTTVEMKLGQVLIQPNERMRYVWFLNDAISSTLQQLSDGNTIESGLMGLEGMVGIQLWLRQRTTPQLTLVQVPGTADRMDATVFVREVVQASTPLNDLLAAYIHGFLVLTGQTAACNRLHPVEQRLCRWLRMVYNRVPDRGTFPLKQEFLAAMLGVQRPTVSVAAAILQKAGWIRYSRGNMEILNPEALITGSCECYRIIEEQFQRIFEQPWADRAGILVDQR